MRRLRGGRITIVAMATLLLLVVGPGVPSAAAAPPRSVDGVQCSQAKALGFDKQLNLHAAKVLAGCGLVTPARARAKGAAPNVARRVPPLNPPPTNVQVSTCGRSRLSTCSESTVWTSDGNTIVVNYNDSTDAPNNPPNYSGISVSHDGGATFTQLLPSPLATGHGGNFGDPVLVFDAALGSWFAGDLVNGCGGQGIGLWSSPDGDNWAAGACAHVGSSDDRESMWVDNNPASPFFGRMYISWNDFAVSALLFVTFSDNGVNWSAPVQLSTTFERDVQLTGAPDSGAVFVAAMDEGGGGFNTRLNIFYRSVDGGATWTRIVPDGRFAPPGDSVCNNPYFARISPIWRHMGWGQPGVGPGGVVMYAYAGAGVNPGDTGDIFFIRSTDNGDTWSAPIVLNSDAAVGGTAAQWMPSLSVSPAGKVQVAWYDRRDSTDGQNYEYFGIQSQDNGATFAADFSISDQLIPQPEQPDPFVQACYAGDYNYHTAFGSTSYATWTDGRIQVQGHNLQNVFFAAVP